MAAGDPLTSTANLKTWVGLTDSGDDALFARLVTAASAYFYAQTARKVLIGPSTVTEKRNGNGRRRIYAMETPITAISSVSVNTVSIVAAPDVLSSGFGFDDDSIFLRGYSFELGFGNVTLVYSAGYASGAPELAMIEQAVIVLAGTWYKRKSHLDEVSHSLGGQITVSFQPKDVPPEVQTIINRFVRTQVFG